MHARRPAWLSPQMLLMLLMLTSLLKAPEPNISAKFAAAADLDEIDMFAFAADAVLAFEPYLPAMKAWLASPPPKSIPKLKQLKTLDEFAIADRKGLRDAPIGADRATIVKVSPLWVPSELATAVTVTIATQVNTSGIAGANRVSIKSIDNNFVDRAYSPTGYDCMKALNATVVDAHTLRVTTTPTQVRRLRCCEHLSTAIHCAWCCCSC